MEIISFIVLILLSLVGYSAGAVSRSGKFVELKPQIIDLILMVIIWIGAVYSRLAFDLNKWLLILIWVILSSVIGLVAVWPRNLSKEISQRSKKSEESSIKINKNLWRSWKNFSSRMGSFQSRIILSLFFFFFVFPFALVVKIFSDPLRIKNRSSTSHWLSKKEIEINLNLYRRQF